MISFSEPSAGMNQPSSGTPSSEGKVTSSYARLCSDGVCIIGERSWCTNASAVASRIPSISSLVGVGAGASVALDIGAPLAQPALGHDARLQYVFTPLPETGWRC